MQGRVVLDIGCNAGLMLYSALGEGAVWAMGWDRPQITDAAQQLLFSLGASRFHLQDADINPAYPLYEDIPEHIKGSLAESVVFYFSVRQHIGLLEDLQQIPWRVLLYEGHQGEKLEDVPALLADWLTDQVTLGASMYIGDGDSESRPFCILIRK